MRVKKCPRDGHENKETQKRCLTINALGQVGCLSLPLSLSAGPVICAAFGKVCLVSVLYGIREGESVHVCVCGWSAAAVFQSWRYAGEGGGGGCRVSLQTGPKIALSEPLRFGAVRLITSCEFHGVITDS